MSKAALSSQFVSQHAVFPDKGESDLAVKSAAKILFHE